MAQQFETVQFLPSPARERLSGELVCYARSVVHQEWPRMESGTLDDALNPWGVAVFRSLRETEPRTPSEQAAFSKYLDQRSDREDARSDRTHGGEGVIPTPLWIVLFLSAAILFVFMLFFADSGERAVVQATMMGGVAVLVSSLLLLLWFLDNPFHGGTGSLQPVAMERTVELLHREASMVGGVDPPCDAEGVPDAGMIFFQLTSWELGLLLFAVILGATGLGVFLGRRVRHLSETLKEPFGVLQAALLGLVALLLAFGLSLAVSRYEDRRSNIVTGANAIGTTYLRAQTLAEPVRTRSLDLLVRYTRTAIRVSDCGAGQRRGAGRPRTGGADRAPALEPRGRSSRSRRRPPARHASTSRRSTR